MSGKTVAINELGAGFCQCAFIERRKLFVKFLREDKLQYRVAEKFQPLIVFARHAAFMRDGWMRKRENQQMFVAELIAETILEFSKTGHETQFAGNGFALRNRNLFRRWRKNFSRSRRIHPVFQ